MRSSLLAAAVLLLMSAGAPSAAPSQQGRYVAAAEAEEPRRVPDPVGVTGGIGIGGFTFPLEGKPKRIQIVDDVFGTASIGVIVSFQVRLGIAGFCTDADGSIDLRRIDPPGSGDMYVDVQLYETGEVYQNTTPCENSAATGTITVSY